MTAFLFSSGLKAEIDGVTLSIDGFKIRQIEHIANFVRSEVVYTFTPVTGLSCSGRASIQEWDAFEDWMSRHSVQLAPEPERNPPIFLPSDEFVVPTPTPAKNKPGCPECWDTGFRHGFGAPCSHGCRP